MDIKKKIGTRIKTLRTNKALSQNDLAFYAGLDRSYLAGVENGKRNISVVNIDKLTTALQISIKDFFDDASFEGVGEMR